MINLSDFQPLSIAKISIFSINNRGFTEDIQWQVHAILMEEVAVQTTLPDSASFRRFTSLIGLKFFSPALKFRAKYSHINL